MERELQGEIASDHCFRAVLTSIDDWSDAMCESLVASRYSIQCLHEWHEFGAKLKGYVPF